MFKILIFCSLTLYTVQGYSTGAPEDSEICQTLQPKHPHEPQTKPFPFIVTLDKSQVTAGEVIVVDITSPKNDSEIKFKGFVIQGRKFDNFEKNTTPFGRFQIPNEINLDYKPISCGGQVNNTLTHSGPKDKTTVRLTWMAPEENGDYIILTTMAQNGAVFWVTQPSVQVTVN